MDNYELVQKGFRSLLSILSEYIGKEFSNKYGNYWWNEVLSALSDQYDLPTKGEYGELIDSLDIANCLRLIQRKWWDVFEDKLQRDCKTWAIELMGVRNVVAHAGQQDLEQPMAERAIDTMALLVKGIDTDTYNEIRAMYAEIRSRANDVVNNVVIRSGVEQPQSYSKRGKLINGSLLSLVGTDLVQKTELTKKITYAGKTDVYPVYKVRLDADLFYNDQNDRIATWITRYESENGKDSLSDLSLDTYNRIIEDFIVDSNPDSIKKTQNNINLIGQREPGVTLSDGRVVDGNRRLTCLRRLNRISDEPYYFETVIMDIDIQADKKQIKLLELAIQHGEEKKVDYDPIDYAIGTYRDIEQTSLLTVQEYANYTNESVKEVNKRIEIARLIYEFLEYIKLPEKYHIAREYQVYDLFTEMSVVLKKLNDTEQQQLKFLVFGNIILDAVKDRRSFIRDIKTLINNQAYSEFFLEQSQILTPVIDEFDMCDIHSKENIDSFAASNENCAIALQNSKEKALLRSRSQILIMKPSENVSKCVDLLMEIDARMFSKMDEDEKKTLSAQFDELIKLAANYKDFI